MNRWPRARVWVLALLTAFLAVPVAGRVLLRQHHRQRIFDAATVPPRRVAIVFGAGIYPDGRLGLMLEDRVAMAAELVRTGKAQRLLMTGDNRIVEHDEPGRMRDHAITLGVPADAIQLDYGGRRTYDSCYRATRIFGLTDAILVTQDFHLPRALLICRGLGLDAVGVTADRQAYAPRALAWSEAREFLATTLAVVDLHLRRPPPVLGDPIRIP
jgi:SanA protein